MTVTCKNCNHNFEGNYCNNCGQSAETHPINFHFLWHDIQHGLFHFEKGILYTLQQLFIRPGKTIREFIQGKRARHFKPLSLVVILTTVYVLLEHFSHFDFMEVFKDAKIQNFFANPEKIISEWTTNHYSGFTLSKLPLYAIGSFIAFRKQGYNYVEHIVINAFVMAQFLILQIATLPFLHYFPNIKFEQYFIPLQLILLVWNYSQIFNKITKVKSFLLTLLAYTIYFISYILVVLVIFIIIAIFII